MLYYVILEIMVSNSTICEMVKQGYSSGSCLVENVDGSKGRACDLTLRKKNSNLERVITSYHLSRPEDYLSIYQSGCNHTCLKCKD